MPLDVRYPAGTYRDALAAERAPPIQTSLAAAATTLAAVVLVTHPALALVTAACLGSTLVVDRVVDRTVRNR